MGQEIVTAIQPLPGQIQPLFSMQGGQGLDEVGQVPSMIQAQPEAITALGMVRRQTIQEGIESPWVKGKPQTVGRSFQALPVVIPVGQGPVMEPQGFQQGKTWIMVRKKAGLEQALPVFPVRRRVQGDAAAHPQTARPPFVPE